MIGNRVVLRGNRQILGVEERESTAEIRPEGEGRIVCLPAPALRQIEAKALRKMRHPERRRHLQGFGPYGANRAAIRGERRGIPRLKVTFRQRQALADRSYRRQKTSL